MCRSAGYQDVGPVTQAGGVVSWIALPDPSPATGGIGDEAPLDDVAEPSFQCTDGGSRGVAFGELAVIEPAAGAVTLPQLGHGGDVDGVVDGAVPAAGQPAAGPFRVPRGPFSEDHSIGPVPL